MALQAVDLGANKEEEEALYKTVMVTDHGQQSTLIGLDFKARSDRESERGGRRTDGRSTLSIRSPAGGPKFWTEGRLSVCRNLAKRRGIFLLLLWL